MKDFHGRLVVITGAGAGIGKATALAFARRGAIVLAVDIDKSALKNLSDSILLEQSNCITIFGNASNPATGKKVIAEAEKFGRVDQLFNNAGHEYVAPLLSTSLDIWKQSIDNNVTSTIVMTKACLPIMIDAGFGVIINNASDAGIRGVRDAMAYSVTKAAVVQLSRSITLDYSTFGIRCNCVCPGCIRTKLCEQYNTSVGSRIGKSGEEVLRDFVENFVPQKEQALLKRLHQQYFFYARMQRVT